LVRDDLWEVEFRGKTTRILNYKLELDNPVMLEMAGMKPLMYRLLKQNGLCSPEHLVFSLKELDAACHFLSAHPKGCVVKPAQGTSSGLGVTTHVLTSKDLRRAAILASLYCPELIIEPNIPGESYRMLVLNGKMIHAVCRRGPRLCGDGLLTVSELIGADNRRRRCSGEINIIIDQDCLFTLGYQNLTLESVPEENREFVVKSINEPAGKRAEVRTVYNKVVTDLICRSLINDVESAARILRSEFAGVDIITTDPTVPLEKSGGVINEVNTTPGLHHHYNVESKSEQYPQAAVEVLTYLLEK
jgi:cyanophycin synthetase